MSHIYLMNVILKTGCLCLVLLLLSSAKCKPEDVEIEYAANTNDSIKSEINKLKVSYDSLLANLKFSNSSNYIPVEFEKLEKSIYVLVNVQSEEDYSLGTAFVVDSSGLALTNYHVIKDSKELVCGRKGDTMLYDVTLIKFNEELDYAILQLNPLLGPYNYLAVSNSSPNAGEDCYSIGHPQGLSYTLTKGIISAYRDDKKWIQTDAASSHGNSGGPLLNNKGEIIGINTLKYEGENLNFALNITEVPFSEYLNQAENIFEQNANSTLTKKNIASYNKSHQLDNKDCFDRAIRAYVDAMLYQEYNMLASISAKFLHRINSHYKVEKHNLKNVLKQDFRSLNGYILSETDIDWKSIQYSNKLPYKTQADILLTYKHKSEKSIISHLKVYVEINSECEVISAYSDLVNSF